MKICVAQTRPAKGDVQFNINSHKRLIQMAVSNRANMIIFSELSLTGYEPELAKALATHATDNRLAEFQNISDCESVTIAVGMPLKKDEGVCISLLLFQPLRGVQIYSKKYLHSDETAFFVCGENSFTVTEDKVALAICYELAVPEHAEHAFKSGAKIYAASVAKSAGGVEQAITRLAEIGKKYSAPVVMANSIGLSDGMECGGKSGVWNNKGELLAQLNDSDEGIIIFDTSTQEVFKENLATVSTT